MPPPSAAPCKAIFLVSRSIGGVEIRIGRLFCELYRRDLGVYLVTHRGLFDRLLQAGIPLERCRSRILLLDETKEESLEGFFRRKLTYLRWMLKGLRWTRQFRFKAAYLACTGITVGAPLLFRSGTRVIIAYTLTSLHTGGITWPNRVLLMIWLNLCNKIDALFPTNDLRRLVFNRAKISVVPNSFTDPVRFKPAPEKLPWVLWTGYLEWNKDPLLFVEAVAKALQVLGSHQQEVMFHILGDGSMRTQLENRVNYLGLQGRIKVWGWVDHVESFLSRSEIFVSTWRHTNYPSQGLLEAMACENAVIVPHREDTRPLAEDGCALLASDAEELASALVKLIRDHPLRNELGKRGREKVVKQQTIDGFIQHLDSLWSLGLGRPGDRSQAEGDSPTSTGG